MKIDAIDKTLDVCKEYFTIPGKSNAAITALKIISYLTLVFPLVFGLVALGALICKSLRDRAAKKDNPDQTNRNMPDAMRELREKAAPELERIAQQRQQINTAVLQHEIEVAKKVDRFIEEQLQRFDKINDGNPLNELLRKSLIHNIEQFILLNKSLGTDPNTIKAVLDKYRRIHPGPEYQFLSNLKKVA